MAVRTEAISHRPETQPISHPLRHALFVPDNLEGLFRPDSGKHIITTILETPIPTTTPYRSPFVSLSIEGIDWEQQGWHLGNTIASLFKYAAENKIRIMHVGKKSDEFFAKAVAGANAWQEFGEQPRQTLMLISESGRSAIIDATKAVMRGNISPDDINEDMFPSYLSTADVPDVDIAIHMRKLEEKDAESGKERYKWFRNKGVLIYQRAYAEEAVIEIPFPSTTALEGISRENIQEIYSEVLRRERKFGGRPNDPQPSTNR